MLHHTFLLDHKIKTLPFQYNIETKKIKVVFLKNVFLTAENVFVVCQCLHIVFLLVHLRVSLSKTTTNYVKRCHFKLYCLTDFVVFIKY